MHFQVINQKPLEPAMRRCGRQPQAGETIACFAPIARPNERTGESRYFFSSWAARARHNAHTLALQPNTSWVGRRILAD